MNFVGLFKHNHAVEKTVRGQEGGAADPILAELSPPPLQDEPDLGLELEEALTEALAEQPEQEESSEAAAPAGEPADSVEHRATPHTQTRLAALSAFEDLTQSTRQDLQALGLTLAKVTSTQQLMRGFLTGIQSDIHRANELELAHQRLTADHRRLSHQLDEAHKQLSAREAANETLEHRIARLTQEAASLRDALSEARLEASDAAATISDLEAERADLTTSLAGKTLGLEKLLRENEVMREKQAGLSMDLDAEMKAHAESRRKLEELAAVHASDTARLGDMAAKLTHGEKETARLQKQHDTLNASVGELNDTIGNLEKRLQEHERRHAGEIADFESEIQSLNARIQDGAKMAAKKTEEIEALRARLNEAMADKRVAMERFEALQAENARDKQQLSAAFANFSQLNVLQASEHVMLDMHKLEAEELRRQVDQLETTIKRFAPHEKIYQPSKARPGKRPSDPAVKRELQKATNGGGASKGAA